MFIFQSLLSQRRITLTMSCNICCDSYNKSTRLPVTCSYCDFDVCRVCCETYILSETIPKCMKPDCGKEWSRKFLRENFTNVFLTSKFKEHLENILFDQEKALLPATQPIVEEKIRKKNIKKQIIEINALIDELEGQKRALERKFHYGEGGGGSSSANAKEERHHFVRQCPSANCRGFLSTQWKCGICEQWTCPDCHELKGFARDCEHICNPNNVETAKLLAKDSKPCPKCHSLIFKISGCFAENTPILLWDGSYKMSQDIVIGDILVGDDGEKRVVEDLVTGEDDLYEINQFPICINDKVTKLKENTNTSYIVNSKHTLVLKTKWSKFEDINDIYLITIDDYLKLNSDEKNSLYGYKIVIKNDIDTYKEYFLNQIIIRPVQKGIYYGWKVRGNNNRFLLDDFTVVKNCDQMWCTQCHTAFSWKSGKIEHHIHNPHFYEWQRKNATNGVAPRNPGDIECGRDLTQHTCTQIQNAVNKHPHLHESKEEIYTAWNGVKGSRIAYKYNGRINLICDIIRHNIHNIRAELINFQTNYVERNQDLRVKYLENLISEEEFKIHIQRNDKKNRKNTEIAQVIQLANTALTDIVYRIIDHLLNSTVGKADVTPFMDEIAEIINYCNNIFKDIGFTYNTVQYGFNESFQFIKIVKEKKPRKKNDEIDDSSSIDDN